GSKPRQLLAKLALVRSLHRPYGHSAGKAACTGPLLSPSPHARKPGSERRARLGGPIGNAETGDPQLSFTKPNRPLDKASHPCHTERAFNSHTEGNMTLAAHLAELSEKHRSLERQIQEEMNRPGADDLHISRLKREKLKIKDEMTKLQNGT